MKRHASERINKYEKKIDPAIIGSRYDATKELSVKQEKDYFRRAEKLETQVKSICHDVSSIQIHFCIAFAEEFAKKTLDNERKIIYDKWNSRGLSACCLDNISKNLFGWSYPPVPPPVSPCGLGWQDFTTWTEIDPDNLLTVTQRKIAWSDVEWEDWNYVIKDYGEGHFTDFTHKFELYFDDMDPRGRIFFYYLSVDGSFANPNDIYFYLNEDDGDFYISNTFHVFKETKYYCTVERIGINWTFTARTGSYTGPITGTFNGEIEEETAHRYIALCFLGGG